jgi:hypothetical protein
MLLNIRKIRRLNKARPTRSNRLILNAGVMFMKNMKWVGLVAAMAMPLLAANAQTPEAPVPGAPAQTAAAAPVNLSPGAAEVARLAGSGVGDDVVLAYIQNSQAPFNLTADDVLYLKDIGLSPQVTSAMLTHDSTLRGQPQQYAPAAPVAPAPVAASGSAPLTYDWQPSGAPTSPAPAVPPAPTVAVAAPAPTYVTTAPADVSYFYNDLSPYGTWVSLEGYGWCWQPQTVVISHGWRPYCDGGHWVYSDVGWCWQSDYSWGWAPFHYGRWYMHPRCGWVWTPDRVWGPAWVTWRTTGDVCGWAPLPPHADFDVHLGWRFNGVTVGANFDFGLGVGAFAFVGFGDFCGHDLRSRCLPPARVTSIYRQTTIINNYEVHNNTIVHRGIPIERVSAASRTPVPRATVRDLPAGSTRMPRQTGSVVYRPQLRAPAQPVRMAAQKVDDRHPVIQHAPIASARAGSPATVNRGGAAPGATQRRSAVEAPKSPPWSSGAKPATSPQTQPGARSSQPASRPSSLSSGATPAASPQSQPAVRSSQPASTPATSRPSSRSSVARPAAAASQPQSAAKAYQAPAPVAAPATPRAPENWKQGASSGPGYRADAGLPGYYNAQAAGKPASVTPQTSALQQNPHVYAPKSARQAAEIHTLTPADQRTSATPASSGKGGDSRSRKQ